MIATLNDVLAAVNSEANIFQGEGEVLNTPPFVPGSLKAVHTRASG